MLYEKELSSGNKVTVNLPNEIIPRITDQYKLPPSKKAPKIAGSYQPGKSYIAGDDMPATMSNSQIITVEDIAELLSVEQKVDYSKLVVPINYPYTIDRPNYYKHVYPHNICETGNPLDQRLVKWIEEHNLKVQSSQLFYTAPNDSINIHVDHYGIGNHGKINMTWGHPDSRTNFWKLKDGKQFKVNQSKNYIPVITAELDDVELIETFEINQLSIFNAGVLHSTHNPTNQGRWTMSIVVKIPGRLSPPSVEEIEERLFCS